MEIIMVKHVKKLYQMLFSVMLISGKLGETKEIVGTLECHVNYIKRMDCTWIKEDAGVGPFYLLVQDQAPYTEYKCTLMPREDRENGYSCTITVDYHFAETDTYSISVEAPIAGSSNTTSTMMLTPFLPNMHIKFDPPFNLSSNFSNNKFVISWSVESVRSSYMRYELQYKKQTVAWEKSIVKDLRNSVQKVELEASELENDVAYMARLRCKTEEQYSHYRSQWSEWSSHVTFNHPAEKAKLDAIHLFIYLLIPLILVFSIGYLLLNFKHPARVRMSLWKAIPTPADFFLPLYRNHNGNFQDWIRPQDTCDFKTEVEKEGQNLSPFAIITASSLQEEAISQISYIQPQSKNSNTLGEDVCSSLHPSDMTVQQFVESAYVGVNEAERGLTSFFTQDHHNQKTIVSVSEYSKTSDVALIFGDMGTNHAIDVQGEQDSLLFQEFSESGSLHFASDEYSALLYDDFSQSLVPREMLSLLEDSKQFCQKDN